MNDIRIGTPKVSGQDGIPEPFNVNDVIVWKALICKFMCKENIDRFSKSSLLRGMINEEIEPTGAYNKDEMKKAIGDTRHVYGRLIKFCLDNMTAKGLFARKEHTDLNDFDYNSYHGTGKLKALCPNILKYQMFDIEELAKSVFDAAGDARTKIKEDEKYPGIMKLLKHLEVEKEMEVRDVLNYVDRETLEKLIQIGSVTLYLNNRIAISYIGRQTLLAFRIMDQQT
jgi:hypothetical protein